MQHLGLVRFLDYFRCGSDFDDTEQEMFPRFLQCIISPNVQDLHQFSWILLHCVLGGVRLRQPSETKSNHGQIPNQIPNIVILTFCCWQLKQVSPSHGVEAD